MRKELEGWLIQLSIEINRICKQLDKSYLSYHLSKQIIRSSTSAALTTVKHNQLNQGKISFTKPV
jgi:four helix bundle protein